jgi:hypothetical protein
MLETVAKTKWCPFARVVATADEQADDATPGAPAGFNRPSVGEPNGLRNADCIASECMAWRWITSPGPEASPPEGGPLSSTPELEGYCGLAGKP